MNAPPKGWPRISSSLYYDDALAAIEWLCRAFGFESKLVVEHDGMVAHSQLTFGDGLVMVGSAGGARRADVGGGTDRSREGRGRRRSVRGTRGARDRVAMIKIVVPRMACQVIDRAIQIHGGAGLCEDSFLGHAYAGARSLRIADGPDEVHLMTLARMECSRGEG